MLHLKRFDEGVWFDWPEAEGVRLKIKPLSQKEMIEIRSKVRRKVAILIDGKNEIIDDYDESAALWKMFCLSLQEWEGISFDKKDPTREEMLLTIFEHDGIRNFVFEKSRWVTVKLEEKFQDELKNSESSESGSPSKRD